MFTADSVIDTVQNGKKQLVNTFVTNDSVKESLINLVETETNYTKNMFKLGTDTVTTLSTKANEAYQNAVKFDYVKFGEAVLKAYQTTAKK
jgi:hypothetical protein